MNAYPDVLVDRAYIKANQSPAYTSRFRIAGAKFTIDGSPQGFTAWYDRPYYKPVGNYPPGYSGYAAASAEQVMDAVQLAAENGIQVITHANGERASDLLIAAHRAAQGHRRASRRPRISATSSSMASSCARTSSTATRRWASSPRCSPCTPSTGETGTSITPSARRQA